MRRLHESDPDLPIVVVTGHTTFGDDRDVVAGGASVVLKKPIVLRRTHGFVERAGPTVITPAGTACTRSHRRPLGPQRASRRAAAGSGAGPGHAP